MINLFDLVDKLGKVCCKECRVVIVEQVEIDSMLARKEECRTETSPDNKKLISKIESRRLVVVVKLTNRGNRARRARRVVSAG